DPRDRRAVAHARAGEVRRASNPCQVGGIGGALHADGARGVFQGKDAGSARMRRHTGATENAALGRAARSGGLSRVSPSPPKKKLILALVDGLTPSMLEAAVGTEEAPALTLIAENARYTRAVSVFPSLTPVCVSSIVTGVYPDAHRIPHLVWYHREQRRLVEYGSSFGAIRRAGMRQSILDAILNWSGEHLSKES